MMKALVASLLLLIPSVSTAKVMVVSASGISPVNISEQTYIDYYTSMVTSILDRYGTTYKVVSRYDAKTEFCRIGVMTWNFGTAGAYTESFDAVIHVGGYTSTAGARPYAQYRPESLTSVGAMPTVPQLFLGGHSPWMGTRASPPCSSGVRDAQWSPAANSMTVSSYIPGYPELAFDIGNTDLGRTNATAMTNRGYRILVAAGRNTLGRYITTGADVIPAWKDSATMSASPESTVLWKVHNTNFSGASPNIFCYGTTNTGGVSDFQTSPNLPVVLMGLAALDSAASGLVFDKSKLPIRIGFTIDGGWSRGLGTVAGGMDPSDTTFVKASIESLASLSIPFVVGVNLDSVGIYSRDKTWWEEAIPYVRYAPQNRGGLDSAAAGIGNASWNRPLDAWGRYRNRLAYQNNNCQGVGDTSIYCLLRASYWKIDSMFGAGRASRFISAPNDDWSPYNLRATQAGPGLDSVMYAVAIAGVKGIRVNAQARASRPTVTPTNPSGYLDRQQTYRSSFSGRPSINLLAHGGFSTVGWEANANYTTVPNGWADGLVAAEIKRAWGGVLTNGAYGWHDDATPTQMQFTPFLTYGPSYTGDDSVRSNTGAAGGVGVPNIAFGKCNVVRLHVSDFGSGGAGFYNRPGWWIVKSIVNQMKFINRLANKTIAVVDYPENIRP
jgi:hypothetical protein